MVVTSHIALKCNITILPGPSDPYPLRNSCFKISQTHLGRTSVAPPTHLQRTSDAPPTHCVGRKKLIWGGGVSGALHGRDVHSWLILSRWYAFPILKHTFQVWRSTLSDSFKGPCHSRGIYRVFLKKTLRWCFTGNALTFFVFWSYEFIFSDVAGLVLKRTNLGSITLYFCPWGYPTTGAMREVCPIRINGKWMFQIFLEWHFCISWRDEAKRFRWLSWLAMLPN